MHPLVSQTFSVILLVLGFGFVIFWHELGHFLAAKWVGIKVEQFAVGFGHALFSWRKGLGWRVGSSAKEYEAAREKRVTDIGETEYRLNWIPLGGYVKMLGQDDLKPGAEAEDPRAYNRQSIGARMLVVSAGVIMNIILAAIGFMVLFLIGFDAPPPIVGKVMPGSPAQKTVLASDPKQAAPLQVGDELLYFDDKYQHDFTKITLNVALAEEGEATPLLVRRRDGREEQLLVYPARSQMEGNFLMLGVGQPLELRGLKANEASLVEDAAQRVSPDTLAVKPGETIVEVNGQPVGIKDYWKLDQALQESDGKPVTLTVLAIDGTRRPVQISPHFEDHFGRGPNDQFNIAGFVPRPAVQMIPEDSLVKDVLRPGDVIAAIEVAGKVIRDPDSKELVKQLNLAGQQDQPVKITYLRDGKEATSPEIRPTMRVGKDESGSTRYGLGILLTNEEREPVVADLMPGSAPSTAHVPVGSTIESINRKPVADWFEVNQALRAAEPGQQIKLAARTPEGESKEFTLTLSQLQADEVAANRYTHWMVLHEYERPRRTSNPLTAAAWGVTETRDFILQFYLTLQRMVQGRISHK
ncbi:MAG: site-2 protease family protein, partial [Tepidisphaeraceae bacterium]